MENTLLGIVIDVSASMRKNWGSSWEIKQTKIEAIKNALNEEIVRINAIHDSSLNKHIKLFCLGIGFRLSLKLISAELSDGEEKVLNDKTNTILIGIICDILALSELIPSKYKLDKIKKQIHSYWNSSAKNLLQGIEVDEQAAKKLSEYIENELVRSFRVNLHNYIENGNAVFRNTIGKIFYFLGIPISETILRIQAKRLSSKYSNEVEQKANDIFNQFSEKYKKLIHERIQNFAMYEITQMLERNGLGFSIEIILENFDKNQLIRLSESIYNEIKKDISNEFMDIWNKNKLDFWTLKFNFLSMLNIFEVKTKTEYTIKNIGWAKLKPFVEDIVFGIFHDTFETVSKEMLYSWVQVSTKREVIRTISELTNILPDTTEKDIYSEDYMFGGTPMYEAINMATLRFNNSDYE